MKAGRTEKQIMDAIRTGSAGAVRKAPASAEDKSAIEARCAHLEDENHRLKLLVADLTLRNEALKVAASKKW